jgi:predicted GIY-YIG superfamily endonuclease
MVSYANSKIYILKSSSNPEYYISGTTKRLCERLATHKDNYKKFKEGKTTKTCPSFEVLKHPDVSITLLENIECKNKDELNLKIQEHRDKYKK